MTQTSEKGYQFSNFVVPSIVYVDLEPDVTLPPTATNGQFYYIDLNNDGTVDFKFEFYAPAVSAEANIRGVVGPPQNNVMGTSQILSKLKNGDIIDQYQVWRSSGIIGREDNSGVSGEFIGETGFLGLQLKTELGETFYGWVKVSLSNTPLKPNGVLTIHSYAYNRQPQGLIYAGQQDSNYVPPDIVYVDLDPDQAHFLDGSLYHVDFNNDTINDVEFLGTDNGNSSSNYVYALGGGKILGTLNGKGKNFSEGEIISSGAGTGADLVSMWEFYSTGGYVYGNLVGTTGYMGIKIKINGEFHYGWIERTIGVPMRNQTVNSYAYNATPGGSIEAGQTE